MTKYTLPKIITVILNTIAAILLIVNGVLRFIWITFPNAIIAVYAIIIGCIILALEFHIPEPVTKHVNFFNTYIGRGLFYIFFGGLTLGWDVWQYVSMVVLIVIGVVFTALGVAQYRYLGREMNVDHTHAAPTDNDHSNNREMAENQV
ncbi:hypothetical protein CONCODRAFT_168706 [Conidiobolus coronatus NRRL 28638]|uniref:COPI associated n=1 Tax=Conidiobolus coronatus (strain ATCC 28846 / CBS 209.66 / NRRL 28638) TaxID=796925 RepID=A0A137PBV1_CONC2|nr:hypothetical protein CONCODRAFT_168706 [Conidiobolus coronatus NRRL 28638]|eukprot:KXN72497.1 hypothetical protein CONCODRAFT_168706 [Conidiobolus coronatus NRRL 28638]